METKTKVILFSALGLTGAAAAYYFFVYRKSNQQAQAALQTINQTATTIAATKPSTPYPSKIEMLQAAQQGNWESVEPGAISLSYDPNKGTWQRGDWHFQVISLHPIQAKASKGSETAILSSPVNSEAVNPSLNGLSKLLM